jgi:hypothetical protein
MPIAQNDIGVAEPAFEGSLPAQPIPIDLSRIPLHRKCSEESIRTELCDGPVPDSPAPRTPEHNTSPIISDRAELIERLKKGESPTWVPNRRVRSPPP